MASRYARLAVAWWLGLAGLMGCSEPAGADYRLSAVLPSPATPGEQVSAFGLFPAAAELLLEGASLAYTAVPGGLQFVVPETLVAGERRLVVRAGPVLLTGTLPVAPRLDEVVVRGSELRVRGAGWPATAGGDTISMLLNGTSLSATLDAGALRAELPADLPYGALQLRVRVNGLESAPESVWREAAGVRGAVVFPEAQGNRGVALQAQESMVARKTLIVRHDAGVLDDLVPALAASGRLLEVDALAFLQATRLRFISTAAADQARTLLMDLPGVHEVAFDALVSSDGFTSLAAEEPAAPGAGQWHLPLLALAAAWERTRGEGVVVAVLDTGVDLAHPDLANNLLPGYDFVEPGTPPHDLSGHGTHVAGLVAADGRALGTAPAAKLLPVRVLEGDAGGSAFTVAQGILWAAGLLAEPPNAHPAQVVNLSLGTSAYSSLLESAIRQAVEAGVVVVAAAGNAGSTLAYPAAFPGVVAVTALAGPVRAYQPWYANKGAGTWLTAYGGDTSQDQDGDGIPDGILSTDLGGYSLRMGTSMAAPQVAGLAALALASGSPPSLVKGALAGTATPLAAHGYTHAFGFGLATGRAASTASPRSYLVALDEDGGVRGWTLVQHDGSFELVNLPPGVPLLLLAASDDDGNGVLAEAGELVSPPFTLTLEAGTLTTVGPLKLSPSNGAAAFPLEARP